MRKIILGIGALALCLALTACPEGTPVQNKQTQSQKAAAAAAQVTFTENYEIKQIQRRLEQFSKPGVLGFVVLLNQAGQPIWYGGVQGKPTSSGKRLTPPVQAWSVDKGQDYGTEMDVSPSDEGTWGSSSPYIFFWTTSGQYMQWSGDYLYSDQPLRLTIEPLVVDIAPATE